MSDATDLWRDALGVMGYEIMESAFGTPCVLRETKPLIPLHCEWELFGLAVEWIEARGCDMITWDKFIKSLVVHSWIGDDWIKVSTGPTLPEAAARWIVEHGSKIKEVANG